MSEEISPEILKLIHDDSYQTLSQNLGIEFLSVKKDCVQARMPVDHRTIQRFGILHGGASVALAETVASVAGWLNIDFENKSVVGLEINANHLRPVRTGFVTATATPIKIGNTIQVWNIEIKNDQNQITCISRCTLAVTSKLK